MKPHRYRWYAECRFDDRPSFLFGNVVATTATEAEKLLEKLWRQLIPTEKPPVMLVMNGYLEVVKEDGTVEFM